MIETSQTKRKETFNSRRRRSSVLKDVLGKQLIFYFFVEVIVLCVYIHIYVVLSLKSLQKRSGLAEVILMKKY